jgi:hypothetical protein
MSNGNESSRNYSCFIPTGAKRNEGALRFNFSENRRHYTGNFRKKLLKGQAEARS